MGIAETLQRYMRIQALVYVAFSALAGTLQLFEYGVEFMRLSSCRYFFSLGVQIYSKLLSVAVLI